MADNKYPYEKNPGEWFFEVGELYYVAKEFGPYQSQKIAYAAWHSQWDWEAAMEAG